MNLTKTIRPEQNNLYPSKTIWLVQKAINTYMTFGGSGPIALWSMWSLQDRPLICKNCAGSCFCKVRKSLNVSNKTIYKARLHKVDVFVVYSIHLVFFLVYQKIYKKWYTYNFFVVFSTSFSSFFVIHHDTADLFLLLSRFGPHFSHFSFIYLDSL